VRDDLDFGRFDGHLRRACQVVHLVQVDLNTHERSA
jgi:hypothetical protein